MKGNNTSTNEGMKKTLFMVQFAVLLALLAIVAFTPLGSIPIGPIVATTFIIPVSITAIMLGTKAGTLMGFFGGCFSFIVWTFMPPPTSAAIAFLFTPFHSLGEFQGNFGSLLICFVPRILAGTFGGLVYTGISKKFPKKDILAFSLSAVVGSLTNTIGVLGGCALFFGSEYATITGKTVFAAILATVMTNGVLEALTGAVATSAICKPLKSFLKRSNF
jgi:Predicted membrane protein